MDGFILRLLLRAGVFRLEGRWRKTLLRPEETQAECLREILARHADTEYGRRFRFQSLGGPEAYCATLPIVDYEALRPAFERMQAGGSRILVDEPIEMFAVTSGTSGAPKLLPLTRSQSLAQQGSHRIWMSRLVRDHPRVAEGRLLSVVSPAVEGHTPGGIPLGSASGKTYITQPPLVRKLHAVPAEVIEVPRYDARHYLLLAFSLAHSLSCVTSVNPSTLVLLGERMAEWSEPLVDDLSAGALTHAPGLSPEERDRFRPLFRPQPERARTLREILKTDGVLTPRAAWPGLEAICTWHGGNAPFYLGRLPERWGKAATRCLGLRASEGMFSIPLSDETPEGVLATRGSFLEFLPEEEEPGPGARTLPARALGRGRRYRLIITTSGGLYRYDLADIVEVTGFLKATPVVAFLRRAGAVLSITGEKVTEEQAALCMKRLVNRFPVAGFTLTLRLDYPPRYLLAVEPREPAPWDEALAERLAQAFDRELQAANVEYRSKRESRRLDPPALRLLPCGFYADYRRRAVASGRPDGQVKPLHLVESEKKLDELLKPGEGDGRLPDGERGRAVS
ncbi:MAG: GH3 auxin-responsive promoter family protein [Planctomycetota bacterium]